MKRGVVAFFGEVGHVPEIAHCAKRHGLKPVVAGVDYAIFAGEALPRHRTPDGKISVGDIHSRSGAIVRSPQEGWGNYLAFGCRGAMRTIDRAPLTGMPLYWMRHDAGMVCASHLDLLTDLVPMFAIDWEFVAHALLFMNWRTDRTGISGLSELLPGTGLLFDGTRTNLRTNWSPWEHIAIDRDVSTHAHALKHSILRSVAASSASRPEIVVELSGGLDSSIVAASLKMVGANFSAITFATPGADGDERHFARAVAARCEIELVEIQHGDEEIDLIAPPDRLSSRPGAYSILGGVDRAFSVAFGSRDRAIFGGIGGDSVFGLDGSVAPILDACATFGFGRRALETLRDVARAGDATIWQALRLSARARRAGRRLGARRDATFLAPCVRSQQHFTHPWDVGEEAASQARINHVQAIHYILDFLDRPSRWHDADVVAPLLSQPVVEQCLSIPSWRWFAGGRDRAIARAAFAASLPAEVAWRRGKGRLESMCAAAYLRQRPLLRDLLLGGRLAEQGLLDVTAIEHYLTRDLAEGDFDYFRLIEIGDIERWVRAVEARVSRGPSFDQRRY